MIAVRDLIYMEAKNWESLKEAKVSVRALKQLLDKIGIHENFQIVDSLPMRDGVFQFVEILPKGTGVKFSREGWLLTQSSLAVKVGVQMHAYLMMMGIEKSDSNHTVTKRSGDESSYK